MVIVCDKVGQLGNRLYLMSYLLVNASKNNYKVYNFNFNDYLDLFEQKSIFNNKNIKFGSKFFNNYFKKVLCKIVDSMVNFLIKINFSTSFLHDVIIINQDRYDLNNEYFLKKATKKIVFLKGSWYVDDLNFVEYSSVIKNTFVPKNEFYIKANAIINPLKVNGKCLVCGIHFRKGDYKYFKNGAYYLTDEIYKLKMIQAQNFLCENYNLKIKFIIFSNETINLNNFKELDVCNFSNHFMVDLTAMTLCDYLIAPISTFSMWASFYGNVPLWQTSKQYQSLKQEDWQIKSMC